jgi:hypothetical protein
MRQKKKKERLILSLGFKHGVFNDVLNLSNIKKLNGTLLSRG